MKDALFIVVFGVLIYLGVSTLLGESELMGSYGVTFAAFNQLYFGYVSFAYLFVVIAPLYLIYKESTLTFRKAELTVASFLIFFSFLLAQGLLIDNELRGKFGADFVDFLSPYIGLFGLWIFWFIITTVSIVIILDKSSSEILETAFSFIKKTIADLIPAKNAAPEPEEVKPKKKRVRKEVKVEKVQEITEPQEPQEDTEIEAILEFEEEIDKPAYLRKKEEQSVSTILDVAKELKEHKSTLVVEELEENAKLLADIETGVVEKPKNFKLPSVNFLQKPTGKTKSVDESELDEKIQHLIEKLAHFKIDGDVVRTYAGPVVSTFEFKPAANVKVSKILNLQDDLAMALSAETIRIQAPIPGKDVVGIEIPNETVDTIYLREILDDKLFKDSTSPLTIALGKDIVGKPFITDLKKLPHLLIAGTTGSGKSVGINAMILSLLYKNSPDQLRLLMIDPKMLEFSTYNDIPHLLTPVITKPNRQ